ncbi:uncharacterized protein LOC134748233 [Cydia strobilella]|uniref:uncharacterized protein LOC134748233 n=1 Tax=Cydia strobilella TaxID=1100964 RepID=UPI003006AF0B
MRRTYCAVFIIKCFLINFCLGELSIEKKEQVLIGFIDSLNNLPDQHYTYEEGVLLEAEKTNDNTYKICARLKVSDIHNVDSQKILRCRAELVQNEDNVLVIKQGHDCVEEQDTGTTQDVETGVSGEDRTIESTGYDGPVKLYNEVQQPNAEVTSGEQFVAIPRASPSVPCIGCASHVDPSAAGVPELANLGIRHLDFHDPAKHVLRSVVDVERQVQVVNGVRYILTLLVDYDNCTAPDAVACPVRIPCKISILEKPWKKLPDGSKYRAILANNCTAEWLFGDEGEVLPDLENNENNEIHPDPNADPDALKVIHNFDAQARPNQENSNADEVLKNIEHQIIPLSEFEATTTEKIAPPQENVEQIHADEIQRNYNENAAVGQQSRSQTSETNSLLSQDKKKAIDDLMHYFDLDGFQKPEVTSDHHREKRSYNDLQNVNNPLNNVMFIKKLALIIVDYLNKVDMAIQNRVLTDVLRAEDEFGNDQHFYYLQALVSIPCNKSLCNNKDIVKEVCCGSVEATDENAPRILNAFCYEDENHFSKENLISAADPILVELVQPALEKIESESSKDNAIKLINILDATTKKMSGTLTKITLSFKYTNCKKSQDFYNRVNCSIIEDMGSKICQVDIHKIHNKMQINYECTERSAREDFSDSEQVNRKTGNVDPEIRNMVQQALKSLEHKTDANRKLKVVDVKSVSTKLMAGLLTKVAFSVGYTNCLKDKNVDDNTCELLQNTPIRECEAQVWDRPWLADSRQINVKCEEDTDIHSDIEKNEIPVFRKKRSNFVGGEKEKNPNDPLYKQLADESIKQHLASTHGLPVTVKELKVKRVVTQVVAGTLTKIDFDVIPADGEIFSCHSEVWEQPWLKRKEITVTCPKNQRRKRGLNLKGGMKNQDPEDPTYRKLAQESLEKYRATLVGGQLNVKELKVTRVATQVVSGTKTFIDFTVFPTNGDKITCHSEIWEQLWLNKKDIDVNCGVNQQENRAKRGLPGGHKEQNTEDPKYRKLTQESLDKYRTTLVGGQLNVKEFKITKVTTQVVSGTKTFIDFTVFPTNGDKIICHSEIWEQPWLNKKEIDVNCGVKKQQRKKRQIPGGEVNQDHEDPKYKKLAQESLDQIIQSVNGNNVNAKDLKVKKVVTQVVAGSLTKIDFDVIPTEGEVFGCHSEVWERPWLNKKEINVNCDFNKQQSRTKRTLPGGLNEVNPEDSKYSKLAQESVDKYRATLVGGQLNVKELKVTKVATQVDSGTKTFIDFTVFPTNGDEITCHSEIWEQPWLNKKEIDVKCGLKGQEKREIFHDNPEKYKQGSPNELDASEPQFKLLAVESLQKYVEMINSPVHHEVVEVKKVISKVVAGKLYEIDFTAVPTSCSMYEANPDNCIARNDTLLSCHAQVWARPWLKSNEINVICKSDDRKVEEDVNLKEEEDEDYQKKLTLHPRQEKNGKELKVLAQEVLEMYERQSNSMYKHKIRSIGKSYEQISEGILNTIEFYASPTKCLTVDETNVDDCQIKQPEIVLLCKSVVRERAWIYFKDIKVYCNNVNTTKSVSLGWEDEIPKVKGKYAGRHKRDVTGDDDDNYMDDEMKHYYADRALQQLNRRSDSHNLQKMITIHSLDVSNQMGARMIRMYIETAMTFCVRHQLERVDLAQCDEMEGLAHKLCHVRLWPSVNDEYIIRHVVVVCDDDSDFSSVTGFEVSKLIAASLRKLEESPKVKFKLVHQGEPYVMPALSSRFPIKVNFVVLRTNCTKDVDVFKQRHMCFVDSTTPAMSCESKIYLSPNSKDIKDITASCNPTRRERRDVSFGPAKSNSEDAIIADLVEASLEKLETSSLHRYKQRVWKINSYSTEITRGRETTIDFDVGYSSCLKYESIKNISNCEFLEHLPIRHCISHVFERLWVENGRNIKVVCEDNETPLEYQMDFGNADTANQIANEALKHIEAKYPNAKRLQVVRIFSLQKQTIAGIHYRLKMEVGGTDCPALSLKTDCKLVDGFENNKFCRVNVWIRPWTDHPPNFRVICDYQESETAEVYHRMQAEHLFANFLATYRPDYMDDYKEMSRRFKIFRANVRKVHELNIHERGSATYAITQFSDLTSEEFSSKYLGLKASLKSENNIPMIKAAIPKIDLPKSFDWRDHGAVTEVKDQGQCGSCWAFSVTGNVEGQWKLTSGKLLSLSEQELVDCDKTDQGCNGGLMDNAYRAIEELGGLELETDYPYEGADDKCIFNKTLSRVQISGSVNISSNETEMAQWLVANGPISIGINANAMQFYVGGVSHPWKALCSPKNLDHGVLIVGFGIKEYPLFNKHLPYWIVKNSWGKSWGEQGYYRVYRGDGTCGVNQMASSAVV